MVALALVLACGEPHPGRPTIEAGPDAGGDVDAGADAGTDAGPVDPTDAVFSLDRIHEVRIDLEDRDSLVPGAAPATCTVAFDGEEAPESAVSIDGATGLGGKPSFELGFGARLFGLRQLDLDAEAGDPSMLRDHVGLEIFRRAGLAAPRTAFASVSVDGEPYGVYGIRETIDEDFLERWFGDASGNLYEHPGGAEISVDVTRLANNGGPKGDTSDLDLLAAFTEGYPDGPWMTGLADVADADAFFAAWAVDALVDHRAGYFFATGATWLYDRPPGRFVFVPGRLHDAFGDPLFDVDTRPAAHIGSRTWDHVDGHPAYEAALRAILDASWDEAAFVSRLDAADALTGDAAAADPRSGVDAATRAADVAAIRDFLVGRADDAREMLDAVCGNGTIDLGETCDDGNQTPRDGCDARCQDEYCGDGIVSTGEACDDPGCLPDCSSVLVCGDGVVDPGEDCDLGDVADDDGCSSRCTFDACGDGIVQSSRAEACDGVGCRTDCSALGLCGDGTVDTGEDCDDMNADESDGCLSDCSFGDCVSIADASGAWVYCTALRSFDAAVWRCRAMGGELGVPADEAANDVVGAETLARLDDPWWIGGTDRRIEGAWRDPNGAPVRYLPWGDGEPNGGGGQNCLVVETRRFDGGWNDKGCDQTYSMVCRTP